MVLVQKELYAAYIGEWYLVPTSISLDKNSISLTTVWQTEQLTATILPADARQTVTWTSSNTSVATVDSTWLVTCVTPWTCTITVTTVNWLTATCSVKQWWSPWINTYMYFPLTNSSKLADMSWNWRNLTSYRWYVTYWTFAWVDCANLAQDSLYISSWISLNINNWATFSIWFQETSAMPYDNASLIEMWTSRSTSSDDVQYTGANINKTWKWSTHGVQIKRNSEGQGTVTATSYNQRYNVVFVKPNSSSYLLYLNWQAVSSLQWYSETYPTKTTFRIWRNQAYNRSFNWYISNAIVENKAWSAQDVLDYYNLTKSEYWL